MKFKILVILPLFLTMTGCGGMIDFVKSKLGFAPHEESVMFIPEGNKRSDDTAHQEQIVDRKLSLKVLKIPAEYGNYGGHYWGPQTLTDDQLTDYAYCTKGKPQVPFDIVLELDQGNPVYVNRVQLSNYVKSWNSSRVQSVTLLVGNDLEGTFKMLGSYTLPKSGQLRTPLLFAPTQEKYAYMKVQVNSNYGGSWYILNEIEVWGN